MAVHSQGYSTVCNTFEQILGSRTSLLSHVWTNYGKALVAIGVVGASFHVYSFVKRRNRRQEWNSVGKDVVVVHGFDRTKTCVNLSPFGLKLETFLRMSNIKYIFETSEPFSSKKKSPWITINGKELADSQVILNYLNENFNQNLSSHLTDEQNASARAISIMVDEHLHFCGDWWIWKDKELRFIHDSPYPYWVMRCLIISYRRQLNKQFWWNGLGRHTDQEFIEMMRKDFKAISLYLGNKKFLMGDRPCDVDCSVFGTLGMAFWVLPGSPFQTMVKDEFPNLADYCRRMKETFWPDWDSLLHRG